MFHASHFTEPGFFPLLLPLAIHDVKTFHQKVIFPAQIFISCVCFYFDLFDVLIAFMSSEVGKNPHIFYEILYPKFQHQMSAFNIEKRQKKLPNIWCLIGFFLQNLLHFLSLLWCLVSPTANRFSRTFWQCVIENLGQTFSGLFFKGKE